ncbi:MAG: hypothetical protein LBN97_00865 [Oscillospiraceae bacterium]|jgi:hypothetical protein|nr:hypothetical protein [Oscillospiraceae bacterium]
MDFNTEDVSAILKEVQSPNFMGEALPFPDDETLPDPDELLSVETLLEIDALLAATSEEEASAVPDPTPDELAAAIQAKLNRKKPEIPALPDNPSKEDISRNIFLHVEAEHGEIPLEPRTESQSETIRPNVKRRPGDIIRGGPASSKIDKAKRSPATNSRLLRKIEREERRAEFQRRNERRLALEAAEAERIHNQFFAEPELDKTREIPTEIVKSVSAVIEKQRLREEINAETTEAPKPFELSEQNEYREPNRADMSLQEAYTRFAGHSGNIKLRLYAVCGLCALAIYSTIAAQFGFAGFFSDNIFSRTAFMFILQIITCAVSYEIVIAGISDLFRFRFSAELLVTAGNVIIAADAFNALLTADARYLGSYSAAGIAAMTAALFGLWLSKIGFKAAFKALGNAEKSGAEAPEIFADFEKVDNGVVLSKRLGSPELFLRKILRRDFCERVFSLLTPLLLLAQVAFALLASIEQGTGRNFLHSYALLAAGSLPLFAMAAFNLPFALELRRTSKSGTSVAGYAGARDLSKSVGIIVRDLDLFPQGNVAVTNFKVAPGFTTERVAQCAEALSGAAKSGLRYPFAQLLAEYGAAPAHALNLVSYEGGGIGCTIGQNAVLLGSEAFMKLMDIAFDDWPTQIAGAAFLAIDSKPAAVFVLHYTPSDAVQQALMNCTKAKLLPLLATRDFNITPTMLRAKFKLDFNEIEFPGYNERFSLSDYVVPDNSYQISDIRDDGLDDSDGDGDGATESAEAAEVEVPEVPAVLLPSALLGSDDLTRFAEACASGKRLYSSTRIATFFTAGTAILGLILMFAVCRNGTYSTAPPLYALLYQILVTTPCVLINLIK